MIGGGFGPTFRGRAGLSLPTGSPGGGE